MTRRPQVTWPFAAQRNPTTGRKLCPLCGKDLPRYKYRWCSDDCYMRSQIMKGNQGVARAWVWGASLGICQRCGTDTVDLTKEPEWVRDHCHTHEHRRNCGQLGMWEADHIVPICEGGPLTPENLRLLCIPCHRAETKALAARRAAKRSACANCGGTGAIERDGSDRTCPACGGTGKRKQP